LATWEVGAPFRLVRVLDQSPQFLRYLSQTGMPLGVQGSVTSNNAAAGVVTVEVGGRECPLSLDVAKKLQVVAAEQPQ
jgi:DtxR family Mn-dependent transcriptional regulator